MSEPKPELWESTFSDKRLLWGLEPVRSAVLAKDYFLPRGVKSVLIPGVGYGRNAKVFLESGMAVTGIEISATAIRLARSELGLDFPIHHGSVSDMPFDAARYDGVFCYGLIYLLADAARAKLVADCHAQLAPGGPMIFTVISKKAPMYGRGAQLGEDRFEVFAGVQMFFYDEASVQREFGHYGLVDCFETDEPTGGGSLPFLNVICERR